MKIRGQHEQICSLLYRVGRGICSVLQACGKHLSLLSHLASLHLLLHCLEAIAQSYGKFVICHQKSAGRKQETCLRDKPQLREFWFLLACPHSEAVTEMPWVKGIQSNSS